MRTSINPITYFILSPIYIINFGLCCYFMYGAGLKNFAYLTSWTLLMNSVYLIINLIADTFFFFSKKDTLEFLHIFSREKIAPVVNSYTYMVFISFWGMVCMGPSVMDFPTDIQSIMNNIYLHGLITVFVILDLFFHHHENSKFNWVFLVCIFVVFFLYGESIIICKNFYNLIPYPFMKKISFALLLLYGSILFLFVVLGYFIHLGFIALKYKCFVKNNIIDSAEDNIDRTVDNKPLVTDKV